MSLSRRDLFRVTGAAAVAAGWPLLAACSSTSRGGDSPAGEPGTVTLAFAGNGANETLNPFDVYSPAELAVSLLVFDRLFVISEGAAVPAVAAGAEPAADAMSFTLSLRTDVTWHDGSPLTAADVAHSLEQMLSPERPYPSELTASIDLPGIAVTGDHTLTVPVLHPVGDPATLLAAAGVPVVRAGHTAFGAEEALGTGAYRVTSFAPGRQCTLTRWDQHWDGPAPSRELVVLSIDDPQTRINAVRGGQADYAADVPWSAVRGGAEARHLEIRDAGPSHRSGYGFVLNTTRPLMGDPRVRMALRLGIDRQALVDTVFLGHGVPANDLFGHGAQYFASDLAAPTRDPDRARALLAEAGAQGATLTVRSGDYESGLNASTELFVAQLRALGLDARAELVPATDYFDPDGMAAADALVFSLGPFPLTVVYNRSAGYPSLAFPDEELRKALATAAAATDEAGRESAWRTAQEVMADRGNWIVWGLGDTLSLAHTGLNGIEARESAAYPYVGRAEITR